MKPFYVSVISIGLILTSQILVFCNCISNLQHVINICLIVLAQVFYYALR